jgi:hypothetical protein
MAYPTPHAVAERLIAEAPSRSWLRALADDLDRELRTDPLERFMALWGISASEAARAFGVTRQALSKWRKAGVPGSLLDLAFSLRHNEVRKAVAAMFDLRRVQP